MPTSCPNDLDLLIGALNWNPLAIRSECLASKISHWILIPKRIFSTEMISSTYNGWLSLGRTVPNLILMFSKLVLWPSKQIRNLCASNEHRNSNTIHLFAVSLHWSFVKVTWWSFRNRILSLTRILYMFEENKKYQFRLISATWSPSIEFVGLH